jgi:CheY-like chemotaxis protein
VFRVWLSRVAIDTAAIPAHADAKAHTLDISGLFVVVIDDDEAIRFGMTALLLELGCQVLAKASSDEVIAELSKHLRAPDAAMVDFRLGHQNGYEAITALRLQLGKQLPALLMTGDLLREERAGAKAQAQALTVLHKPIATELLKSWLNTIKADSISPAQSLVNLGPRE